MIDYVFSKCWNERIDICNVIEINFWLNLIILMNKINVKSLMYIKNLMFYMRMN